MHSRCQASSRHRGRGSLAGIAGNHELANICLVGDPPAVLLYHLHVLFETTATPLFCTVVVALLLPYLRQVYYRVNLTRLNYLLRIKGHGQEKT